MTEREHRRGIEHPDSAAMLLWTGDEPVAGRPTTGEGER
jgi:hypothetical protein